MKLQVALYKNSDSLIARLIRWQTDSIYCHAAFLVNEKTIVEAVSKYGVRERPYKGEQELPHDLYDVEDIDDEHIATIWEFCIAQYGKGYDYRGAFRFLPRSILPDNDKWFCSELLFAACQAAEIELLERVEPWQVSPGLLARSPRLRKV